MTRTGSDDYRTEHAFLMQLKSLVLRELAHRAGRLADTAPGLAGQVSALIETPIERWPADIDQGVLVQLHSLKLQDSLVDNLTTAIEQTPLVEALEGRIARLEREEIAMTREEPFGRYLLDSAYWRDEDALDALNDVFKNWARWCRGEPLEVPS